MTTLNGDVWWTTVVAEIVDPDTLRGLRAERTLQEASGERPIPAGSVRPALNY